MSVNKCSSNIDTSTIHAGRPTSYEDKLLRVQLWLNTAYLQRNEANKKSNLGCSICVGLLFRYFAISLFRYFAISLYRKTLIAR